MKKIVNRQTENFFAVIGLEIHCQLKTQSKLFSYAPYHFMEMPNTQVDEVTLGLPGVMPGLNKQAVKLAVRAGLALNCQIQNQSKFDRKHYFYPDLPKGYQISQYDEPYARDGYLKIALSASNTAKKKKSDHFQQVEKKIRIERIHLEEDAGRLVHQGGSRPFSRIDLNRAGVPLIEIVTRPDIESAEEAVLFLQKVRNLLRAFEVTTGNMEEGSLRCDANVSIRKSKTAPLGVRVEIKNLNSFRSVRDAITYEIKQQTHKLMNGENIRQVTALWNVDGGITQIMRVKEDSEDYRYFPEPDLPYLHITADYIQNIRDDLPESPDEKKERYQNMLGLPRYDAEVLVDKDLDIALYFDEVVANGADAKLASNWVKDEVLGVVNKEKINIMDFTCTPKKLANIIIALTSRKITSPMAKKIFAIICSEDIEVEAVIQRENLQVIEEDQIEAVVSEVIANHQDIVQKILSGNDRVRGFLVGQVMKKTQGKADPQVLHSLLEKHLKNK